jgi:hypothetical protein
MAEIDDRGWIKLHRKVLDNPVACKDSDHLAVWNYLLLNATHKEYATMFCGKKVVLKPGQLITGRKSIANKFKISESKVERILKRFKNEQQIEQQTSPSSRLISIISWDDYQSTEQPSEQPVNNDRTTTGQRVNTNKNVKNNKNNKNIVARIPAPSKTISERCEEFRQELIPYVGSYGKETIREFFDYWTEKNKAGKKMKFEMQRTFEVSKRLATWKKKSQEFTFTRNGKELVNPNKLQ